MDDLLAISPLDGRYHDKLNDLRPLVSEYGLIWHRLLIEVRWLKHLALEKLPDFPTLSSEKLSALDDCIAKFDISQAQKVKAIEKNTNHDVKAIEYYLREYLQKDVALTKLIPFAHFALTSEDVNNLAYALMMKKARDLLIVPMQAIATKLDEMAVAYANFPMLSRTHGQPATPTTLGKELKNFAFRLQKQLQNFRACQLTGKFNGAVGNYNAHHIAYPEIDWPLVCENFVSELQLNFNPYTTQIEPHDFIAEFLHALLRYNTVLLDLDRNIWGYISLNYFTQEPIEKETGSSTMPHKINPIDFENSEGNLGIANALANHFANKLPISRWQRDLSDSTVLRNLGTILAHSLLAMQATEKGLSKLNANKDGLLADLTQHWEILGEAIQTVMRRYGITDAYEQLKNFSRGRLMTADMIHQFIINLQIPESAKIRLAKLTPSDYLGYAKELANTALPIHGKKN